MSRPTQLDNKAIASLDAEIAILEAAKARLVAQRDAQTAKKATS